VQFLPGREGLARRLAPAMIEQNRFRHLVDVEAPGREQADMPPVLHIRRDSWARFVQTDGDTARDQLRRRRETDGARADDRDGQTFACKRHAMVSFAVLMVGAHAGAGAYSSD